MKKVLLIIIITVTFSSYLIAQRNINNLSLNKPVLQKTGILKINNQTIDTAWNTYIGLNLPFSGYGNTYRERLELINDHFLKKVDLRSSIFPQIAIFDTTIFNQKTDFTYSVFDSVFFRKVTFNDSAHFCLSTFKGYTDFSDATFSNIAYFSGLGLTDTTEFNFTKATLPEILDFSENDIIYKPIDFLNANLKHFDSINSKVQIFLLRTDISKLHLDYLHFKLLFRDPKLASHDNMSNAEIGTVYEQLLNNFKINGQNDSYKILDLEYRKFKDPALIYNIAYHWNKYGYEKALIFYWILFFLLLFTIFTALQYNKLNAILSNGGIYYIENLPSNILVNNFRDFLRLFWYSFIYTSCIFFYLKIEIKNLNFSKLRVSYIILVYTIGFICIGYLASFIFQK